MPTVLFFRPDADTALQYGSHWLGLGVEEATKRGYNVIDLVNEACTYDTLAETIANNKIDVAILLGHGNSDTFTGYEQKIMFQACNKDEIMTGTMSHFLSCSIGQELLPSIIKKKGIWTVGYQTDFQFLIDTSFAVEEDPMAEPFKNITLAIIQKILDGATLKEIWDAGIAKCDDEIARLSSLPEIKWAEVISAIKHDRDGMIGLGDQEAYVLPPAKVAMAVAPVIPVLGLATLLFLLPRK